MTTADTTPQQDLTIPSAPLACHDCGRALRIFHQSGLSPAHPGHDLAECTNAGCGLFKVTLNPDRLAALSEPERQSYRAMRRRQVEIQALDEARCLVAAREYVRKHPLKKGA